MAQTFWMQDRELIPVVLVGKAGIQLAHGELITWEEAKRRHADNPENGLLEVTLGVRQRWLTNFRSICAWLSGA